MTDRVQLNMEGMVSELRDYSSRGIFTQEELKKIVETRRKHEQRLQRREKSLLDFVRYIKSECILEKIKEKRLLARGLRSSPLDTDMSRRIVKLYRSAMHRFSDSKLISQFSEYAVERGMHAEMRKVFAECCTRNPEDVDLWVYCAGKLLSIGDIEGSRAMMLKGIRMNPKCSLMRVEFFRIEVMYIEQTNALDEELGLHGENDCDDRTDIAFTIFCDYIRDSSIEKKDLGAFLEISLRVNRLREKISEEISNVDK